MVNAEEYHEILEAATSELKRNLYSIDMHAMSVLLDNVCEAGKIGIYGVGREGLALKGLAMRLFHLGLQAFVVGEMTASAVGPGDILLVSAGPGYFSTVSALAGEAQRAGCKVIAFISQPPSPIQDFADICMRVPATCLPATTLMNADPASLHRSVSADGRESRLLMGSSYELALQLFFDIFCVMLKDRLKVNEGKLMQTHTNLE